VPNALNRWIWHDLDDFLGACQIGRREIKIKRMMINVREWQREQIQ
jgi:hypothetical protein